MEFSPSQMATFVSALSRCVCRAEFSCGGNALRVEGVVVVEAATVFGIDFIKMTGMSVLRFMV